MRCGEDSRERPRPTAETCVDGWPVTTLRETEKGPRGEKGPAAGAPSGGGGP